jgi:hypothetical protein
MPTSRNSIEDTLLIKAAQLRAGNVFKEYDGSNAPCNYWLYLVVSVEDYDSDRVKVSCINISTRTLHSDLVKTLWTQHIVNSYYPRNKTIPLILGLACKERIDAYFTAENERITNKMTSFQLEIENLVDSQKELEDLRKKALFT